MLYWAGKDQPMKMSESSRDVDKKLHVNNNQKTYLVKTLAKFLDVPYAIGDASSFTAAGLIILQSLLGRNA